MGIDIVSFNGYYNAERNGMLTFIADRPQAQDVSEKGAQKETGGDAPGL